MLLYLTWKNWNVHISVEYWKECKIDLMKGNMKRTLNNFSRFSIIIILVIVVVVFVSNTYYLKNQRKTGTKEKGQRKTDETFHRLKKRTFLFNMGTCIKRRKRTMEWTHTQKMAEKRNAEHETRHKTIKLSACKLFIIVEDSVLCVCLSLSRRTVSFSNREKRERHTHTQVKRRTE